MSDNGDLSCAICQELQRAVDLIDEARFGLTPEAHQLREALTDARNILMNLDHTEEDL